MARSLMVEDAEVRDGSALRTLTRLTPRRTVRTMACLAVLGAVLAGPATAAEGEGLVLKYARPFGVDGIFSVINGERSGHIELSMTVTAPRSGGVDITSLTPGLPGSAWWLSGVTSKFGLNVKERVSADGKDKSIKVPRLARAGPGENIAVGFRCPLSEYSIEGEFVIEYYDGDGDFVGRTTARRFHVPARKRSALSWTFRRADLRGGR